MAGNTRGKLKEHFEGIHRNLDWCMHHVAQSMTLIQNKLAQQPKFKEAGDDPEKQEAVFKEHPLYDLILGLGKGIETFDAIAKDIYDKL